MSKEQILSSDGIPLELSLKKAERKNKLKAVLLVAPLFLFILIIENGREHAIASMQVGESPA